MRVEPTVRELVEANRRHFLNLVDYLRESRETSGLTTGEVASALSMDVREFTKLESHEANPDSLTLRRWAGVLKVELGYTVTATKPRAPLVA